MVSYNIKKFALTFYKWRKTNEKQIFIDIIKSVSDNATRNYC